MVLERQQIRAEERWEELGLAATSFMATQADIADAVIHLVLDRLARGEIKLTAATLLESARFLKGIDNRELEAETGRERLRESIAETRRAWTSSVMCWVHRRSTMCSP